LWYAESGERLCPDHAAEALQAGQTVHPPERYAEGIVHSEISAVNPPKSDVPYRGNSADVMALLAAVGGVMGLASCFGLGWLLPFVGFLLALAALLQARDAVDPGRTRWLAGVGLASGSVFVLIIAGYIVFVVGMCAFSLAMSSSGPRFVPTPTPYFFPTATP
jgi:hypothetical protein